MKPSNIRLLAAGPILLAVVLIAIGIYLWRQVEPLFQSTAIVQVVRDQTDLLDLSSVAPQGLELEVFLQNEILAVRSDAVLQKVITNSNLAEVWKKRGAGDPLSAAELMILLRERVEVSSIPGESALRIRAAAPTAEQAQQLTDAFATAYCEYRIERRRRLIQESIDVLANAYRENTEKIERATEKLEQARAALSETVRHQNPPPRPDYQEAEALRAQLNRLTMTYLMQSNQVAQLQNLDAEQIAPLKEQLEATRARRDEAAKAVQTAVAAQEALRQFWLAQEELETARKIFAPIRQTVAAQQEKLNATENPPAVVEERASPAVAIPTRMTPATLGCFVAALSLLGIGIAIARAASPQPRRRN